MSNPSVTITGYQYDYDGTTLIVSTLQDFGDGPIEIPFVYRDGTTGYVASLIRDDLANNNPTITAAGTPEAEPLIPLSARQIRLILNRNGYLSQVEPALNLIEDETERNEALIEWTYASSFEPDHPLIETMRVALGITEADMETMWREGMTI